MKIISLICLMATSFVCALEEYQETLHKDWKQTFTVTKVLYEEKSEYEHLIIFENPTFGRVLALDGNIQITEGDEFIYQEMISHVPLLAHGNAKKVLIIGGGDGAVLRRVLMHDNVEKVTLVEIDAAVVEFSKKYLGFVSQGSFGDPRAEVIIEDGSKYVKETAERFDVIICDSPDPEGPAVVLFTPEFYGDCKGILNEGGVFVNHSSVPFLQGTIIQDNYHFLSQVFKNVDFYVAAVPTYVGGFMAFGFSSDKDYSGVRQEELLQRLERVKGRMRYYNPRIHLASFALPEYIINSLIPKN